VPAWGFALALAEMFPSEIAAIVAAIKAAKETT